MIEQSYPEKPLCVDLFCGLGGWSSGFLSEGYRCIGYDIEAHEYWVPDVDATADGSKGTRPVEKRGWTQGCAVSLGLEGKTAQPCTKLLKYPGKLILRDVRSIHGKELKDATCIVASPPCQAYSYRAMPWKRAKALPPPDNTLFNECFRIQREASEAAGRYIPLIVENVRGAQKWVGRASWNYGSFYLWGDVPALMPMTLKAHNVSGFRFDGESHGSFQSASVEKLRNIRDGESHSRHLTNPREHLKMGWDNSERGKPRRADGVKMPGINLSDVGFNVAAARLIDNANKPEGFTQTVEMKRQHIGYSRKAASAMIAKIPLPLAQHIARTFKP